jgi:hypothetical protein
MPSWVHDHTVDLVDVPAGDAEGGVMTADGLFAWALR